MQEITFDWNGKIYKAAVRQEVLNGVPAWIIDFRNGYSYVFIHDGWKWSALGKLGFRITKRIGMELDKLIKKPS